MQINLKLLNNVFDHNIQVMFNFSYYTIDNSQAMHLLTLVEIGDVNRSWRNPMIYHT